MEVEAAARSILLVDDDIELGQAMREFFARRQLELEAVHDSDRGLRRALEGDHDLILLDVMMPGLDGLELLRRLRQSSMVPVIMLTAKTRQMDRVAGLDAGADDYLPKPFGPEELLARIRAVLRRSGRSGLESGPVESRLEAGGITVIPSAREIRSGGVLVSVTSIEFDILEHLIRSAGRTVTRESMTSAIYHRKASPFDRALDMHVSNLRKKLGPRERRSGPSGGSATSSRWVRRTWTGQGRRLRRHEINLCENLALDSGDVRRLTGCFRRDLIDARAWRLLQPDDPHA